MSAKCESKAHHTSKSLQSYSCRILCTVICTAVVVKFSLSTSFWCKIPFCAARVLYSTIYTQCEYILTFENKRSFSLLPNEKTSALRSRISSRLIFASCVGYFDRAYYLYYVPSCQHCDCYFVVKKHLAMCF